MSKPTGADEWQSCAVCARMLENIVDQKTGRSVGWQHPGDIRVAGEDHPAVPVPESSIDTERRCDFCFWIHPEWELPTQDFRYDWLPDDFPMPIESKNNWAACDACAELLREDKWFKLVGRAKRAFLGRYPYPETGNDPDYNRIMSSWFAQMYQQLQRHVTGPVRRIKD